MATALLEKYNGYDYVWLYGSLGLQNNTVRDKYLLFNINNKKLISGYFWRLYDDKNMNTLESNYKNNSVDINLQSTRYTVQFTNTNLAENCVSDNTVVGLQKNSVGGTRPVIRIKWCDAVNNLLINMGLNTYIYQKNNNYYFFNTRQQTILYDCEMEEMQSKLNDMQVSQKDVQNDISNKQNNDSQDEDLVEQNDESHDNVIEQKNNSQDSRQVIIIDNTAYTIDFKQKKLVSDSDELPFGKYSNEKMSNF